MVWWIGSTFRLTGATYNSFLFLTNSLKFCFTSWVLSPFSWIMSWFPNGQLKRGQISDHFARSAYAKDGWCVSCSQPTWSQSGRNSICWQGNFALKSEDYDLYKDRHTDPEFPNSCPLSDLSRRYCDYHSEFVVTWRSLIDTIDREFRLKYYYLYWRSIYLSMILSIHCRYIKLSQRHFDCYMHFIVTFWLLSDAINSCCGISIRIIVRKSKTLLRTFERIKAFLFKEEKVLQLDTLIHLWRITSLSQTFILLLCCCPAFCHRN